MLTVPIVRRDISLHRPGRLLLVVAMGFVCLTCRRVCAEAPLRNEDEFATHVRTTEPLLPEQERLGFRVPEGFEVQLVASEPQIAKPMNLAFDSAGRLWVTSSSEYPLPAKGGQPARDTIKVLEDRDGDGFAETVTTFAEGLNIPIGLYPYRDGVICFSIPNILFLRDTDGDGKADHREVLYGPFDTTRDTHGMCNAFTRGFDGWLYACHGFNNRSTVTGKDGHQVTMSSGNTFRMKLDGSRIEHYTHGQVNPFGLAFNERGDAFTADCHTKPVTLLLQGGFSPSFGAPHDGLGFVPPVMQHLHGSTAIGGIAICQNRQFPNEYFDNEFGGNVMTGCINRNRLEYHGGTVRAIEQPNFLVSSDPWFRPVDLQFGPDGALYVADFYNRIIGHYEVPLDHPGRDRHRGRIWRIVYKGGNSPVTESPSAPSVVSDSDSPDAFIKQFDHANLAVRMQAVDSLDDRFGSDAVALVRQRLASGLSDRATVHAMWYLHRSAALEAADVEGALTASSPLIRTHTFRIISESDQFSELQLRRWITAGIADASAEVSRAAAMAAQNHPPSVGVKELVDALLKSDAADVHLRHALRMSLRERLRQPSGFTSTGAIDDASRIQVILSVCPAIDTVAAANYLVEHLDLWQEQPDVSFLDAIRYASRNVDLATIDRLITEAQTASRENLGTEEQLLRAIANGLSQRGIAEPPNSWKIWARDIVTRYLNVSADGRIADLEIQPIGWTGVPFGDNASPQNVWQTTRRRKPAGQETPLSLVSSLPAGEQRTGIYRSEAFELPQSLSFYIAGHDGFPDQPAKHANFVRLVSDDSRTEIQRWPAPRTDVATPIQWDADVWAGTPVYLELVDGDSGTAYAWLAAGEFSLQTLNPTDTMLRWRKAAAIAREFSVPDVGHFFRSLLEGHINHPDAARDFALAITGGKASAEEHVLAESLGLVQVRGKLRQAISEQFARHEASTDDRSQLFAQLMAVATADQQQKLAGMLAQDKRGLARLIRLIESGKLAASVVAEPVTRQRWEVIADNEQRGVLSGWAESAQPTDQSVLDFIAATASRYHQAPGNVSLGKALFTKHCSVCHQVAGEGTAVGPNLDGIGNRGLERVAEDVFWPGRNVDAAFRTSAILTTEGQVLTGLIKREEGNQVIIVGNDGKPVGVSKEDIEQIRPSDLSPMPADLAKSLGPENASHLLRYLLSLRE